MRDMILKPQFIDRGGNTVYLVYEDDPDCRILRPGKMLGQVRFSPEQGFAEFEIIDLFEKVVEELEVPKIKRGGTG